MKKKIQKISYYALFKDGSFVPLTQLSDASKIIGVVYYLEETMYSHEGDSFNNIYYDYKFISEAGEDQALRVENWELVYLSSEYRPLKASFHMTYKLYNHHSQTVTEFIRKTRGMDFFKQELFPKLFELAQVKDYNEYVIINKLQELLATASRIEKKINNSNTQ